MTLILIGGVLYVCDWRLTPKPIKQIKPIALTDEMRLRIAVDAEELADIRSLKGRILLRLLDQQLVEAVRVGKLEICDALLAAGVDPNADAHDSEYYFPGSSIDAFDLAVLHENPAMVRRFLEAGAKPDTVVGHCSMDYLNSLAAIPSVIAIIQTVVARFFRCSLRSEQASCPVIRRAGRRYVAPSTFAT